MPVASLCVNMCLKKNVCSKFSADPILIKFITNALTALITDVKYWTSLHSLNLTKN